MRRLSLRVLRSDAEGLMAPEQTSATTPDPAADEPTGAEELDLRDALRRELVLIEAERLVHDLSSWFAVAPVPPEAK